MCTDMFVLDHKIYGSNNWFYAYGKSSHREIIDDTKLLARLCKGIKNLPYMVIDDGWQPHHCDGSWNKGNEKFPDMSRLAREMKAEGVRPGIWVRYIADHNKTQFDTVPADEHLMIDEQFFAPSHPDALKHVVEETKSIIDWGYELIKHDFTTYDIFGGYSFSSPDKITPDG